MLTTRPPKPSHEHTPNSVVTVNKNRGAGHSTLIFGEENKSPHIPYILVYLSKFKTQTEQSFVDCTFVYSHNVGQ
jgi:hypothetical protein